MKLIKSLTLGLIAVSALTYSCGGGSTSETTTETAVTPPPAAAPVSLEEKYKDKWTLFFDRVDECYNQKIDN